MALIEVDRVGPRKRRHADDLVKVEHRRMAAGWFWVFEDEPDAETMRYRREPGGLYSEVVSKFDLLVFFAGKVSWR